MIVTQISDYRYPSTMVLKAHCMGTTEMGAPERSRFPRNYEMHCHLLHCHFELALEFHDCTQ